MQHSKMDYGHMIRVFARLISYMPDKARFWIGSALSLLQLATSFLIPYLYQTLIAGVQAGAAFQALLRPLALPFVLLLLIAPLICLGTYWQHAAANGAAAGLQKAVNAHVTDMPVSSLETDRADKLLRATANAQVASSILSGHSLNRSLKFPVFTGGSLILLLIADWRFALLGVLCTAAMFALATLLNARLRTLEASALEADATAAGHLMQMIANLPIVKIYRLESHLLRDFERAGMSAYRKRRTHMQLRGVLDGGMDFLYYAIQPLAILIGVNAVASGSMPFAQVVYIAGLLNVMLNGMHELGYAIQLVQKSLVNAERTFGLLDEPVERAYETTAQADPEAGCAVAFRDVHFEYVPGKPTLRGIDLRIRRGQHVALVGPSGCGKSTLLKLILRFYEIGSGEIALFGASISGLDSAALRGMSAYIPQDSGLFDGTIQDNILLGNEGRTPQQLAQAMKDAALYDYVQALPQRELSPVGEGGALLSGGQGQRIAIARALLKDAPLILLDEATSALDVDTEGEIHRALSKAAAGKTILCVTHRLTTIADFDLIVFLKDGAIVEQGTHEELMSRKGAYYSMYNGTTSGTP